MSRIPPLQTLNAFHGRLTVEKSSKFTSPKAWLLLNATICGEKCAHRRRHHMIDALVTRSPGEIEKHRLEGR